MSFKFDKRGDNGIEIEDKEDGEDPTENAALMHHHRSPKNNKASSEPPKMDYLTVRTNYLSDLSHHTN